MAFVEDLSLYFADFGKAATLDGAPVSVIFDNGSARAAVGPFGMATTQPQVTIATASVPSAPVGKAMVVNGTAYTIAEHQPDGTGISMLLLEAA